MSASLTLEAPVRTMLDSLTCAHPTAADLRERARFWREYAAACPDIVTPAQAARIATNCRETEDLAMRWDTAAINPPVLAEPTPKPALAEPVLAAPPTAVQRPARSAAPKVSGQAFWAACAQAVAAVTRVRGPAWKSDAVEETASLKLPKAIAEEPGHFVLARNRWDFTVPAALYWPGGAFPAGVDPRPNVRTVWRGHSDDDRLAAMAEQKAFEHDVSLEGAIARVERQIEHARGCLAHARQYGSSKYGKLSSVEDHESAVEWRETKLGQLRDQIEDRDAFQPAWPPMMAPGESAFIVRVEMPPRTNSQKIQDRKEAGFGFRPDFPAMLAEGEPG